MVRLFLRISLAGSPAAAACGRLELGSEFSEGLVICVLSVRFDFTRCKTAILRLRIARAHTSTTAASAPTTAERTAAARFPSIAPVKRLGNPPEMEASYRN